jgi:hypothetical protein
MSNNVTAELAAATMRTVTPAEVPADILNIRIGIFGFSFLACG